MLKKSYIPVMCVAVVLAFALAGCGSSGGSASSAASGSTSASASASAASSESGSASASAASSAAAPKEFPKEYTNDNGGVTLAAVLGLNGPDLVALLEQQGYEFNEKRGYWQNPANENLLEIHSVKNPKNGITMKEYEAAAEPGELAKGMVSIRSYDYDLSEISEEMYAGIRESMLPGFNVDDIKYLAFGGECWAIVSNDKGDRYLLEIGAYDEHTATVRLETDEYAAATDSGSIDEIFN